MFFSFWFQTMPNTPVLREKERTFQRLLKPSCSLSWEVKQKEELLCPVSLRLSGTPSWPLLSSQSFSRNWPPLPRNIQFCVAKYSVILRIISSLFYETFNFFKCRTASKGKFYFIFLIILDRREIVTSFILGLISSYANCQFVVVVKLLFMFPYSLILFTSVSLI